MPKTYHPFEVRVQVLTLHALGYRTQDISSMLEVPVRTVHDFIKKARDRGFNPAVSLRVKREFIEDNKFGRRLKGEGEGVGVGVSGAATTAAAATTATTQGVGESQFYSGEALKG